MNIVVLGAGAWGTALAVGAAAQGGEFRQVTLWARDAQQADDMRAQRENRRYLPGVALPPSVGIDAGPLDASSKALAEADLLIIGTPMSGLRGMLQVLAPHPAPVAWLCKGFEAPREGHHGLLGHEVRAQVAPRLKAGVLSGPSFAQEVARGQPTALVAASEHASVRDMLVAAFHSPTLRVYANEDIVGVEVGGAVKNLLAIATGLCDGLDLGLNARAALITRGLAEIARLGAALGGSADTIFGLTGAGDLILTATGDLSRNRRVGLQLSQGMPLPKILHDLGHVAEGVHSAREVAKLAKARNIEMPVTDAVNAVLEGKLTPKAAVEQLLARDPKQER